MPYPAKDTGGVGGEEEQEVEDGHDGQHHAHPVQMEQAGEDAPSEEGGVDPGQPLHLHGNDKEEQHL